VTLLVPAITLGRNDVIKSYAAHTRIHLFMYSLYDRVLLHPRYARVTAAIGSQRGSGEGSERTNERRNERTNAALIRREFTRPRLTGLSREPKTRIPADTRGELRSRRRNKTSISSSNSYTRCPADGEIEAAVIET